MQLIIFVTLLKVDTNLLSSLIRFVDTEADDHSNGRERAESRGINRQWVLTVLLNGSFVKMTAREFSGYQYHYTNLHS